MNQTMRERIVEVLEHPLSWTKEDLADKILGIVKDGLPKERPHLVYLSFSGKESRSPVDWEKYGYNQALTDVIAKLEEK